MKNNYFLHNENKLKAVIKFMQKAHLRVNTRGKVMAYTCGAQTVSLHDGILDDSSTSQSKIK